MKLKVEISSDDVRKALTEYISRVLGLEPADYELLIETKSTQNYRAEWEVAAFRATLTRDAV